MYGGRISLQNITKEARSAACRSFAVDVDFENAHAPTLSNSIQALAMKNVRKFIARHRLWRQAVDSYHTRDDASGEKVPLRAIYGFSSPTDGVGRPGDSTPRLAGLATDSIAAHDAMSSMSPEVMALYQTSGLPRPASTAFAFLIGEIEESRLASKIPQTPAPIGNH